LRRGRRGVGARVAGLGRAVALALSVAATLVALGAALVVDTAVTAAVAAAAPTRTPVPSPTTATSSPAPAASAAAEVTPAPGAHVNQLTIDGTINPAVAEYVRDAIERSQEDGAAALLLVIDTPGGLLASTRTIVKEILGAPLPTLAYVAPSGAGAGSAGVFIVMSADVAAMAPGTNIGASTPVQGSGKEIEGAMGEKVKSFVASFAKAIATRRGRNVEWAERAVREAVSATDEEALSVVRHLVAALPSGGYLVCCDATNTDEKFQEAQRGYDETGAVPYRLRSPEFISQYFEGLELVEPGLVQVPLWRPEVEPLEHKDQPTLAGVGRKP